MMAEDPVPEHVRSLVSHPRESLSVELKSWIDPGVAHGLSKLVLAFLALRNNNGGFLLVGFDDATGARLHAGGPDEARSVFHADVVQAAIVKYASEPFEVVVHFVEFEGLEYPVFEVPSGVKTPVATKSELRDGANILGASGNRMG